MTAAPSDQDYLEKKSRIYGAVVFIERVLSMWLLTALLVLIGIQVFTRYVLNSPFVWTEELARFVLIWFAFMSAAFVMARRRHITVLLYSARSSGRVIAAIDAFAYFVVLMVSAVMTYGGWDLVRATGRLNAPATDIPLSVVYAALLVGSVLMTLHAAFNLYLAARYPGRYQESDDIEKIGL
ncbi:TRAP transporter small permease [Pseudactinotalea sp. Z1748]|uniref:TRAP transporter small permease n=1 Tax=Pseudactinotalea sp. Z1748 TaxID=3413027 RepID=UPI003C799525